MKDEKRVIKGYKIKNSVYQKALKKCKDEKLATKIEGWVTAVSQGLIVEIRYNYDNEIKINEDKSYHRI